MTTKAKIWNAINRIYRSGRQPTYLRIREELGGGSYTTIASVLRQWRKVRDRAALSCMARLDDPPDLPEEDSHAK